MKRWVDEFREFVSKGNVLDMAVGVIIGGAFSKIITSLVNDVIMPLLSILLGKINISSLTYTLPAVAGATSEVVLKYGNFLQNILDFFIIALCIFMMIKAINKLKNTLPAKPKETAEKPPEASAEEKLLVEIRDLLKKQTD